VAATVVIGGQFGSEGKGKVAHFLAQERAAAAVVRVGGSNSGHTAVGTSGPTVLRQLPTAALLPDVLCVLGPGSYIDIPLLLSEVERTDLDPARLLIDRNAVVITDADREAERNAGLREKIGSTCSGTGAAVRKRVDRSGDEYLACRVPSLEPFVGDTSPLLRDLLDRDERVVVEGTQGFGLSVLHSPYYPKATSRDTSAAGAISEAGLGPRDVDEIFLVIRSFPIRVAGDSGPLEPEELNWRRVAEEGGHTRDLTELTSVTRLPRRVGRLDPQLVRRAISVNQPTSIVMNHVDLVDAAAAGGDELTPKAAGFVRWAAEEIGQPIDLVGLGPDVLISATVPAMSR
jgi:adenylosuccinate synthase